MRILGFFFYFSCATVFASPAISEDAELLFNARGPGVAGLKSADAAIVAYESLLGSLKGEKLAEAVDRLGRLAYYRGEMLGKDSETNFTSKTELKKEDRAKIFDRCRTHASKLKLDFNGEALPASELDFSKIGDDYRTPFTYWYFVCTALWFRDTPVNVPNLNTLTDFFNAVVDAKTLNLQKDFPVNTNYLAGGIQRALAGSFTNASAKFINKLLPDQNKALEFINLAILSPSADELSGITDPIAGQDYFSNYRVKIDILMNAAKKIEAKAVAESAIAKIEDFVKKDKLPAGHKQETLQDLLLLKDQVTKYKL